MWKTLLRTNVEVRWEPVAHSHRRLRPKRPEQAVNALVALRKYGRIREELGA